MFPIPWNFPFRKKNGDMSTIGAEIGGAGSELPPHSSSDAGKLLGVKPNGSLEWSDTVNSEIQTLTNKIETRELLGAKNLCSPIDTFTLIKGTERTKTCNINLVPNLGSYKVSFTISNASNIGDSESFAFQVVEQGVQASSSIYVTPTNGRHSVVVDYDHAINDIYFFITSSEANEATVTISDIMITAITDSDTFVPYAMTNRELTPIKATITPASGITLARNKIIKQGKLVHIFFKIESPAPDTTSTDVVIGVTPFLPENDFVFMPCYDIDRPFEIKHSAFIRKSTGEIVFPAGSAAVPVYAEGVYACQ